MTQANANTDLQQTIAAILQTGVEAVRAKADEDEAEALSEFAKIPEAMRNAVKNSGGQAGVKLSATVLERGNWHQWQPFHRSTDMFLDLCDQAGLKTVIYHVGSPYPRGYKVVVEFSLNQEDVNQALLKSESQQEQMQMRVSSLKAAVREAVLAGLADQVAQMNQRAADLHKEAMDILSELPAKMRVLLANAPRNDLERHVVLLVRTNWVKMKPVDDLTILLEDYCSQANLRTCVWGTGKFAQTGYELRVIFTAKEFEDFAKAQS